MALTILEGSTFCICDERGDIWQETGGFFAEDTRFLSLFRLTVNGETPLLLSSGKVEYFSAAFYLRNPLAGGLAQDSLSIVRERFVSDAMQDRIVVENVTPEPVSFNPFRRMASDLRVSAISQPGDEGTQLCRRRRGKRGRGPLARPGRDMARRRREWRRILY